MKKQTKTIFGKKVYLLGKDKEGINYWLEEPSYVCGWYWGFGYIETYTNNQHPERSKDICSHQHFDSLFLKNNIYQSFKELFVETPLSDKEIWILLELMQTFYTLKESAKIFELGGSNICNISHSIIDIKNKDISDHINKILIPKVTEEVLKLLSTN